MRGLALMWGRLVACGGLATHPGAGCQPARSLTSCPTKGRMVLVLVPVLVVVASSGCGYRLAGRGDLIPPTVKTIAVQPFGNATPRYKLARLLPSDISREFIARTVSPDRRSQSGRRRAHRLVGQLLGVSDCLGGQSRDHGASGGHGAGEVH